MKRITIGIGMTINTDMKTEEIIVKINELKNLLASNLDKDEIELQTQTASISYNNQINLGGFVGNESVYLNLNNNNQYGLAPVAEL